MLRIVGPVLYFLLLILQISLDFSQNAGYKQRGFSNTLLEKSFEFVPNREDSIVAFHLSFVLLLVEVDSITGEQSRKRDAFGARGTGRIKMVFTVLTEVVTLHVQVPIVEIRVFGLERAIARCKVCLQLIMFLALDKRF